MEAKSDPVESFIIQHHNCLEYTDILPLSTQYFKKCEDLVHKLHVISSRALGIPEVNEIDYFRKFMMQQMRELWALVFLLLCLEWPIILLITVKLIKVVIVKNVVMDEIWCTHRLYGLHGIETG